MSFVCTLTAWGSLSEVSARSKQSRGRKHRRTLLALGIGTNTVNRVVLSPPTIETYSITDFAILSVHERSVGMTPRKIVTHAR